jgi:hypothetical protein
MNDWDTLNTFADWKDALDRLLAEAKNASLRNDAEARWRVCAELRTFVLKSHPNTEAMLELDRLAAAAARALSLEAVTGAVGGIESRTGDLGALADDLRRIAADASSSAASLRLERVRTAMESLAGAARALTDLGADARADNDEELSARITTLLGLAKELGDALRARG